MGVSKEEKPRMFPHPASHSRASYYGARVTSSALSYPPSEHTESIKSMYLFEVDANASPSLTEIASKRLV